MFKTYFNRLAEKIRSYKQSQQQLLAQDPHISLWCKQVKESLQLKACDQKQMKLSLFPMYALMCNVKDTLKQVMAKKRNCRACKARHTCGYIYGLSDPINTTYLTTRLSSVESWLPTPLASLLTPLKIYSVDDLSHLKQLQLSALSNLLKKLNSELRKCEQSYKLHSNKATTDELSRKTW